MAFLSHDEILKKDVLKKVSYYSNLQKTTKSSLFPAGFELVYSVSRPLLHQLSYRVNKVER
jgi:hypothetical protein